MLTEEGLSLLCHNLGLLAEAQSIIRRIRTSPPSRLVRSAANNVSTRYPSRKMGVTIQAESHTVELAGIYEMEHDDNVLEYYDQPEPIKLNYKDKKGKKTGFFHTPDFFVIRQDGIGWEEWKTEEKLRQLLDDMPNRYVRGEDDNWLCPPGEAYTSQFGLYYRVRSSAEINWHLQNNLRFLEDYLRTDLPPVDEQVASQIISFIEANPGVSLDNLLRNYETAVNDTIYALIAKERIYIDLEKFRLTEPERVPIFLSEVQAKAYSLITETKGQISKGRVINIDIGAALLWDGRVWRIINIGDTQVSLIGDDDKIVYLSNIMLEELIKQEKIVAPQREEPFDRQTASQTIILQASPKQQAEANRRYEIIKPFLEGQKIPRETASARTIRSWIQKYKEAQQILGSGYYYNAKILRLRLLRLAAAADDLGSAAVVGLRAQRGPPALWLSVSDVKGPPHGCAAGNTPPS